VNLDQLAELVNRVGFRKKELAVKKNGDYSNAEDVHTNFKTVAELCRLLGVDVTTPEGCLEYMVLHKIHRLFKLINSGKKPDNESLFDNNVDTQVYLDLLLGVHGNG